MRSYRHIFRGFTLLELVLVLLVMAVISGLAAPRLMRFAQGRQTNSLAQQIVSLTHYARSQAIADSRIYTLNLDGDAGVYWIATEDGPQGAKVATQVPNDLSLEHKLPDGVTMSFTPQATQNGTAQVNKNAQILHFYADGRVEPGDIDISDGGVAYRLSCPSATESYRLVQGGT